MEWSTNYPCVVFLVLMFDLSVGQDLWREDLSKKMNIGVSDSGFRQISLKCGENNMDVTVDMEANFDGVIYTRGNFYKRDPNCFIDAQRGRTFRMSVPLDKCNVKSDGNKHSVVIILQHDNDLITPGDGAFTLECHYRTREDPRLSVESSISLADPDPSGKDLPTHMKSTVKRPRSVIFKPSDIQRKNQRSVTREEL